MNKKFMCNWVIVSMIFLSVAGVLWYAHLMGVPLPWLWPGPTEEKGFDPIAAGDRIEEAAPNVDVMHIGVSSSYMLGVDVFHVGIRFWPEENLRAVELTDTGWRILAPGEYTWEPGQQESEGDKWRYWTEAKYEYFSDNAMFPPGKAQRAKPAVDDLHQWHEDALTVRLLNAVFLEAMSTYDVWPAIEISYLGLREPIEMPGVDSSGEPGYVQAFQPVLGAIEIAFKKLPDTEEGEGYWILGAMEQGGLTVERYRELKELKTISVLPGFHPFLGSLPYTHGFNHPWQGK